MKEIQKLTESVLYEAKSINVKSYDRMDLVRMSQDEGNFIIKVAKKKGLEFK